MVKGTVFVIMPFNDSFFDVYGMIKRKLGESYKFINADVDSSQHSIVYDIMLPNPARVRC
jgi:poly-D-alanine transfer protein DltD